MNNELEKIVNLCVLTPGYKVMILREDPKIGVIFGWPITTRNHIGGLKTYSKLWCTSLIKESNQYVTVHCSVAWCNVLLMPLQVLDRPDLDSSDIFWDKESFLLFVFLFWPAEQSCLQDESLKCKTLQNTFYELHLLPRAILSVFTAPLLLIITS